LFGASGDWFAVDGTERGSREEVGDVEGVDFNVFA